MKTSMLRWLVLPSVVLAVGALAFAGPLDPPAGAIGPTYKTLTEIEPRVAITVENTPGDVSALFKITQPGSYYLTGNITGVVGKHGIAIAASDVTLDLNGFELKGVPGMGSYDGVSVVDSGRSGITIRNGSVRGWGGQGLDLSTNATVSCVVSDLRVLGNGGIGIQIGADGHVSRCTAGSNGSTGIATGYACTITECTVSYNAGHGVAAAAASSIFGCTARNNTANGFDTSGGRALISNCMSASNTGNGFALGTDTTIADCAASSNIVDGISGTASCRIRRCSVRGSTGAAVGIHVSSTGNYLEGNSVIGGATGIKADTGGNRLARNTCSANSTNWNIANGNYCYVVVGASSGGILGNSGGVPSGVTDSEANFSY